MVISSFTCSFAFSSCPVDQDLNASWNNLGGKLGLNWAVSDDGLVWASWTRGYRSGGFNGRNPNPQTPAGPFGEETVDAFEVGSKLDFAYSLTNHLRLYSGIAHVRNIIIYDEILIANASASLRLPGDKLTLTLYGRNLSEEQYGQGAAATSLFFVDFIASPREWGIRLSYDL